MVGLIFYHYLHLHHHRSLLSSHRVYYLSYEFVNIDKCILLDRIQNLSVCRRTSSHFPRALISCLYETENKYAFHAAVILLRHTHIHTHQNTVMKFARCSIATILYFYIVNAATIFPNPQFLFDFNFIKFEGDIAVSTRVLISP